MMVTLSADLTPMKSAIAELSALAQAAELSPQAGCRLLRLVETAGELFRFGIEGIPTEGAGEFVYRVQPSELMFALLATCRAGNPDLAALEEHVCLHRLSPNGSEVSRPPPTYGGADCEPRSPHRRAQPCGHCPHRGGTLSFADLARMAIGDGWERHLTVEPEPGVRAIVTLSTVIAAAEALRGGETP